MISKLFLALTLSTNIPLAHAQFDWNYWCLEQLMNGHNNQIRYITVDIPFLDSEHGYAFFHHFGYQVTFADAIRNFMRSIGSSVFFTMAVVPTSTWLPSAPHSTLQYGSLFPNMSALINDEPAQIDSSTLPGRSNSRARSSVLPGALQNASNSLRLIFPS